MSALLRDDTGALVPVAVLGAAYDVAVTGSSTPSPALGARTTIARLVATVDTRFAVGLPGTSASPTNSTLLPAGSVEYVAVQAGWVVAAVQQSGPGVLNITELR